MYFCGNNVKDRYIKALFEPLPCLKKVIETGACQNAKIEVF
jgi:hypothetical protein